MQENIRWNANPTFDIVVAQLCAVMKYLWPKNCEAVIVRKLVGDILKTAVESRSDMLAQWTDPLEQRF